jgi:hypothetical protein
MVDSKNKQLLDRLNLDGAWVHAKKKRPIWAKLIESQQEIATLEGTVNASTGDYLCRGENGEIWPQKAARLAENYEAQKVVDADDWRLYMPKREAKGVMAAIVPHTFVVYTQRGEFNGKAGDYVLKNYEDKETEYPDKIWVVDQELFAKTYRIVGREIQG